MPHNPYVPTPLKVCFHERRLQYQEHEHFNAWHAARPGERVLNVDIPLSYAVYDVKSPKAL
jgi:transcription factor CP2-like protein